MAYECLRAYECFCTNFFEKTYYDKLAISLNLSSVYMGERALTKTLATTDFKSQSETVSIVAFRYFQIVATVSKSQYRLYKLYFRHCNSKLGQIS